MSDIMNKRYLLFALLVAAGLLCQVSCKRFETYQINPNLPTQADPSLLLTTIEQNALSSISPQAGLASRYLAYTESVNLNQYYGWQRSGFDAYGSIRQVVKMEQEAARTGKQNYRYLGKFFRSYYIIGLTLTFGDVPYSQMMRAMNDDLSQDAIRPAYDKQEDIYLGVLNDLKIASDSLSVDGGDINGDVVYNGDISKWKKAINAFSLRVLISLSAKEGNTQLLVKQRFREIVADPAKYPLFGSNSDNLALPFYDINNNRYPYYNNNSMKTDYYLDSSFVSMLKRYNDPRLFVYGMPATATGLPAGNFNAYAGMAGSAPLSTNVQLMTDGKASQINRRYAYDPVNEPSVAIGYAELQFTLAEAAARGWIDGDANAYYKNGVQAAMQFSNYKGTGYTDADIQHYLEQPVVQLQGDKTISQIVTQKYIALFMNTGWEAFYNQRRTGIPVFETAGSGMLNDGKVPVRWMYPTDEYNNNGDNVNAAVKAQFPNGDDINGVMWLLKNE
ncbi:SusD/RagB family nutrient-binding outer membrane lipoprotein [Chitinophaga parva]|uniref:SusD/RagB family nutrient-binding outer membrane lipoprotein n=1 Tax=Chitinophaga parva TaxID=2169414 RepID=A0A2T7BGC0_9BACT|nr:SusD/RagB family nutrient-binding outer membrane lipoprotein [Chitinophaga parva]PUZ25320.1 SusD/RagB family nutrient-binding outer membrane lipoprotein [Chitinophaga parva]